MKNKPSFKQRAHDFTVDVVCGGLKFVARRWHNVRTQLMLASLHGLLQCFGIGGTLAILAKVKKQYERNNKKVVPAMQQASGTNGQGTLPGMQTKR